MSVISKGFIFIFVMILAVLSGLQLNNGGVSSTVIEDKKVEVKEEIIHTETGSISKIGENFSFLVQKSMEVTVDSALTKMQDFIIGK